MNENTVKIQPQGTIIAKAVAINGIVSNFLFLLIFFIIWMAGIASMVVLMAKYAGFLTMDSGVLWLSNLFLVVFLIYFALRSFYLSKIKHPKPLDLNKAMELIKGGNSVNLYSLFSFELARIWKSFLANDPSGQNSDLLIGTLLDSRDLDFILMRLGYNRDAVLPYLKKFPDKVDVVGNAIRALEIAVAESHHQIETGDMFIALSEKEQSLINFLSDINVETADLANIVYWQTSVIRNHIKYQRRVFDPDNLHLTGGVGRDWVYGFTPLLKQYAHDITASIAERGINLEIVGHNREIAQMEESLTRGHGGNVLLVGEAGVGKKTTLLGFAQKVYEGRAAGDLNNKHVVEIDLDALLAGAGDGGEITQRITAIFNEAAYAGNMIVFVENIQNLFSSGDAGKVNAVEVLLPFLEVPGLYIVGSCDISSYSKYIATNSKLVESFSRVDIEEPILKEMYRILEDAIPAIEYHTNSLISYSAIKEAIRDADKYIMNIPNPEKSINLLDGATAKASSARGQTIITAQDIDKYVAEKYDVPSVDAGEEEKQKLLNLENTMHQRVVGQRQAIDAIANALRRARAGVVDSKKPIGSFLFLGTTGVGKTETAKALAEAYFGDSEKMIRFDMSEFQNKQDIYRFIGSNMGEQEEPGLLTTAVREHPFSLLLFDELEKANPDILNLFLQILDEGHLTDGSGRKVSFTNTIIIATSNAGSQLIRQSIDSGIQYETLRKQLLNYIIDNSIYRPEFINRFSGVIVFSPLSQAEVKEIAALMIKNLATDLYKNKGVKMRVAGDAVAYLAQLGFDPTMGARPMARVIEEKLEDMLAKRLLSGEINKGDEITVTRQDFS